MMRSLWKKRAYRFWLEAAPYFRYAMMGGLTTTFVVILLAGGYGYARLLHQFPANFPYLAVIFALLTLVSYPASVRTYLKRADLVHLLPFESQIASYLKPAVASAYLRHACMAGLAAVIALPVYRAGRLSEGETITWLHLAVTAAVLIVIKCFSVYASFREGQLRDVEVRRIYRCMRFIFIAVYVGLLLTVHPAISVWIGSLLLLIYLLLLRLPDKHSFHWEYFVQSEERAVERIYAFLSWFVDVPESSRGVQRRRLLNAADRWIKPVPENAYFYLYWKFFQRSELSRIVFRLTIAGVLFVAALSSPAWKLFVFIFFAILIAAQLTSVYSYHLHLVWGQVYPLPEHARSRSAAMMSWIIYCVLTAFLLLPLLVMTSGLTKLAALVAGILVIAGAYRYFHRKAIRTFSAQQA